VNAPTPDDRGATGNAPAWSPPPVSGPGVPPPGTPGMAPPPRPPLRRPREGRVLAGVGAGLAVQLGIDVTVVRILIVVLTLVTNGLGLVAYLVAAVLIPADDGAHAAAAGTAGTTEGASAVGARDPLFWVGIGLLVLGALLLLSGPLAAGRWFPLELGPQVVLPLVLIGFGLALWRAGDRRDRPAGVPSSGGVPPVWSPPGPGAGSTTTSFAPATPASTMETPMSTDPQAPGGASAPTAPEGPSTPPAAPLAGPTSEPAPGTGAPDRSPPPAGGGAVPPVWSPPPVGGNRPPQGGGGDTAWTPPPAPERPSSLLGRITFGLALVTVGVLWVLEISGVSVGVGRILAAGLLVLGLGLLVGGFVGRARWLILPAALLTPIVLLASILSPLTWADVDVRTDGVGERIERPASVAEAEAGYQLGAGSLRLDLTGLELAELEAAGTTDVAVQIGAGEVLVEVPDDVTVVVSARTGAGQVTLFDLEGSGLGVERTAERGPEDGSFDEVPTIALDVQVGFGTVDVRALPADRSPVELERRSGDGAVDDVTDEDTSDTTEVIVDDPTDDTADLDDDDATDATDQDEPDAAAAGLRVERVLVGA
jgi:phage shock protein PspC (stress-responsive transcriptional regulator)